MSLTAREFLRMADNLVDHGYRVGPKIGEGTFSKIRIVERSKDGTILAAKIVNKKTVAKDYVNKFLPRELDIVFGMNHPNIITTHDIIQDGQLVFLIMDYAEKGDLLNFIRNNGALSESDGKRMFLELVNAVGYIHDQGVAHRDLKCENILIMRDKRVAVSDFGFSRTLTVSGEGPDLSKTFCGSTAYASPELIRGIPYDPRTNDIWSTGCILYVMVCGIMPFDDRNLKKMLKTQLTEQVKFPSRVNDKLTSDCKKLICQILEPDLKTRLTIGQILESDWLNSKPSLERSV